MVNVLLCCGSREKENKDENQLNTLEDQSAIPLEDIQIQPQIEEPVKVATIDEPIGQVDIQELNAKENKTKNNEETELETKTASAEENLKEIKKNENISKAQTWLESQEKYIAQSVNASQFVITPAKVKIITNSWIDIHEEFSWRQQIWEEEGFTAREAQAWIKAGFKPNDLSDILNWKNLNFTADQVREWINIGLDRYRDYYLAYYCQTKQLTPAEIKDNLEQYRTELARKREQELKSAQAYVDFFYPLANRSKIKELSISQKQLTGDLNLMGFDNLTRLIFSRNKLTNLNFINTLPVPEKLTKLYIKSNNITSNLTPLSKLVNLQDLDLSSNFVTGSLVPLQHCLKLEKLDVKKTNLTPDLQYLPLSLSEIWCDGKIAEELALYGKNLMVWQTAHPQLMKEAGQEIVIDNNDYTKSELKTVTTIPKYLVEHLKSVAEPVAYYQLTNLNYSQFALRDGRPFAWENKKLEKATSLPLRLYNLQTKQVKTTERSTDIKNYLALSYVWGTDWEKQKQKYGQDYETDLTQLGRKALNKVLATEKLIPINHIWIDNFCINQGDKEEKGQEVARQQQYYNNASATLIAIDGKVGEAKTSEAELAKHVIEQIVASPWFKRSWTFQEGLLSKQTIFMFDDKIVDGRILANYWGGVQEDSSINLINLNTTPTIFITPLGWNYGTQKSQTVQLGLSQALHAVSHRGQTVSLDGLYSILGLLPYGQEVQVNYQPRTCPQCPKQKESKGCQHAEENKQWHKYTQEELNTELRKLMELAIKNGYSYEPISWLGTRSNEPELWKFPTMKEDGSSEITGFVEFESNSSIKFSTTGWEFIGGGKGLVIKDDEETGSKAGDIIICPCYKQIKSTNKLEITLPIANKVIRPIVFGDGSGNYGNDKLFLDMVNKELITGEELITQYQQQLPLIQEKKQFFSLVYGVWGNNVTVNNSLVWQIQGQYYLVVNEQLQAIPATDIWQKIHPAFADPALIKEWTNKHWTYGLVQWWGRFNDKFNPQDYNFYTWARDIKKLELWKVEEQENDLRTEFQTEQLVAQIEQPPK